MSYKRFHPSVNTFIVINKLDMSDFDRTYYLDNISSCLFPIGKNIVHDRKHRIYSICSLIKSILKLCGYIHINEILEKLKLMSEEEKCNWLSVIRRTNSKIKWIRDRYVVQNNISSSPRPILRKRSANLPSNVYLKTNKLDLFHKQMKLLVGMRYSSGLMETELLKDKYIKTLERNMMIRLDDLYNHLINIYHLLSDDCI